MYCSSTPTAFLAKVQLYSFEFTSEKYKCTGTSFFSYNKKTEIDTVHVTTDRSDITDFSCHYAFFYLSDLQEYKVTSKSDNATCSLYVTRGNILISLESA